LTGAGFENVFQAMGVQKTTISCFQTFQQRTLAESEYMGILLAASYLTLKSQLISRVN